MYTVKGGFYGDALVMLEEQDLVLHYLSPLTAGGLQLRKKDLTEAIYGYDRASVYTAKSLNSRAEVKPCKKCIVATNSRYSMSLQITTVVNILPIPQRDMWVCARRMLTARRYGGNCGCQRTTSPPWLPSLGAPSSSSPS